MVKNKKGVMDFFYLLMLIFALAIITFIGSMLITEIRANVGGTTFSSDTAGFALEKADEVIRGIDYLFIFIIAGLIMIAIASGFWIKSAPAFFFVSVLAIMIVVLLAAQFANIFEDISNADKIVDIKDNFPIINHFMKMYPLYLLIMCVIITIVIYAKTRWQE